MADNNLNTQLQAIHARLDRIDDDLIANYAGISELVTNMAMHPTTAGAAVKSLKTYNFSPSGHKLVKALLPLVPGYSTFKSLQHLDTASLLNNLEANLKNAVSNVTSQLTQQLEAAALEHAEAAAQHVTAVAEQAAALVSQQNAAQALENAITSGANQAIVSQLTSTKQAADQALNVANNVLGQATNLLSAKSSALNAVNQAAGTVSGFITTLTDIASGKTHNSILRNTAQVSTATNTASYPS